MANMRKFMEAAKLTDGGVVNVHHPLVFTYRTEGGRTATHTDSSMRIVLEGFIKEFDVANPEVQQWLRSNFLNFCARGDFTHPVVVALFAHVKHNMRNYIANDVSDVIYGSGPGSETYPDVVLYGNTVMDNRFERTLLSQLPEWMQNGYAINPAILYSWHEEWLGELIDYLAAVAETGASLKRVSVPDAVRQSVTWHTQRFHAEGQDVEGQDIRTIMAFKDGWRMVQLLTPQALDRESYLCSHCVGKGGYDKALADGSRRVFSLRDAENKPYATLAALPDGSVIEAKGHSNGMVDSVLHAHIHEFLLAAGFVLKADYDKIGLRRVDWTRKSG